MTVVKETPLKIRKNYEKIKAFLYDAKAVLECESLCVKLLQRLNDDIKKEQQNLGIDFSQIKPNPELPFVKMSNIYVPGPPPKNWESPKKQSLLSLLLLKYEQGVGINMPLPDENVYPVPAFSGFVQRKYANKIVALLRLFTEVDYLAAMPIHGKHSHRLQIHILIRALEEKHINLKDDLTITDILQALVYVNDSNGFPIWGEFIDVSSYIVDYYNDTPLETRKKQELLGDLLPLYGYGSPRSMTPALIMNNDERIQHLRGYMLASFWSALNKVCNKTDFDYLTAMNIIVFNFTLGTFAQEILGAKYDKKDHPHHLKVENGIVCKKEKSRHLFKNLGPQKFNLPKNQENISTSVQEEEKRPIMGFQSFLPQTQTKGRPTTSKDMLKQTIDAYFTSRPSANITLGIMPLCEALMKNPIPENIQDILEKARQYITTAEFNYLSARNHQKDGPILCKTPEDIIRLSVQLPTLAERYVSKIDQYMTLAQLEILFYTSPMAAITAICRKGGSTQNFENFRQKYKTGTSTIGNIINNLDLNQLLYECCRNQYLEAAEFLIKKGADVNSIDSVSGLTPLYFSCAHGYKEVAELLIRNKADVNKPILDKYRPIHPVCKYGRTSIVKLLVENGADVNALSKNNRTPMQLALHYKRVEVAQYLRDQNAILAKNRDGQDVGPLFFLGYENKLQELAEKAEIIREVDIIGEFDIWFSTAGLLAVHGKMDAFNTLRSYKEIHSIPDLERKGVPEIEHANFIKVRSKKLRESKLFDNVTFVPKIPPKTRKNYEKIKAFLYDAKALLQCESLCVKLLQRLDDDIAKEQKKLEMDFSQIKPNEELPFVKMSNIYLPGLPPVYWKSPKKHSLLSLLLLKYEQGVGINMPLPDERLYSVPTFSGFVSRELANEIVALPRLFTEIDYLSVMPFHGKHSHRVQMHILIRALEEGYITLSDDLKMTDILQALVYVNVLDGEPIWNAFIDNASFTYDYYKETSLKVRKQQELSGSSAPLYRYDSPFCITPALIINDDARIQHLRGYMLASFWSALNKVCNKTGFDYLTAINVIAFSSTFVGFAGAILGAKYDKKDHPHHLTVKDNIVWKAKKSRRFFQHIAPKEFNPPQKQENISTSVQEGKVENRPTVGFQ